jgi:hypothetical protein
MHYISERQIPLVLLTLLHSLICSHLLKAEKSTKLENQNILVDVKSRCDGPFRTSKDVREMPELVLMSTDSPLSLPPPVTVKMSPGADVELTVEH